jgi:hypothetical protein
MAALLSAAPAVGLAREASLELAVKATYLYKFAPFVEWPAAAFESPASPMNICIVGADPFGVVLDQAVAGQRFVERPIEIHRLSTPSARCHIAYIGGNEAFLAQALGAVRASPVLTVTDVAPGATLRGTINFVIVGNHVRFQIDEAGATRSGLIVSSKLLRLARSTRPRN